MKNGMKKSLVFFALLVLVCACTAIALAEAAPDSCPHTHLRLDRVSYYEPATCTSWGYQIAEWSCADCGAYMGEYRQDTAEAPLGHA